MAPRDADTIYEDEEGMITQDDAWDQAQREQRDYDREHSRYDWNEHGIYVDTWADED